MLGASHAPLTVSRSHAVLLTEEHHHQRAKREGLSLFYPYLVSVPKYVKWQEKDQDGALVEIAPQRK